MVGMPVYVAPGPASKPIEAERDGKPRAIAPQNREHKECFGMLETPGLGMAGGNPRNDSEAGLERRSIALPKRSPAANVQGPF